MKTKYCVCQKCQFQMEESEFKNCVSCRVIDRIKRRVRLEVAVAG